MAFDIKTQGGFAMSCEEKEEVWGTERSSELYQVAGWGARYFRVGDNGHLEVCPDSRREDSIDLYELVNDLEARGLELPLLIRFSDIVMDRIRHVNECFAQAIEEYEYPGTYRGVFPVKVNQQRHLIDEVVAFGGPWRLGLEAGSKPELLVALAASTDPESLVICNGFKDRHYIETALLAQSFSKTVVLVLERFEELELTISAALKTGLRPVLGVRSKLSAQGVGRWKSSSGPRAKFGLTAAEIVDVVERLREVEMLDCLQLLHFHVGSQISSILPIKNALREAAQLYIELARMGAKLGYLDVGGGLAVDYDGSKTDYPASKNYGTREYAADVVTAVLDTCEAAGVEVPTLVSESGRALAAHQSVLVFDVVGESRATVGESEPDAPAEKAPRVIEELYETYLGVRPKNAQESYHDALQGREEAESLFNFGHLSLQERAQAERIFWACCKRVLEQARRLRRVPEEIEELSDEMAATYYCNFSVFQSAPDFWAIGQLFPIVPIHRLDEEPTVRATLADITCDSDGKVDRFIDVDSEKRTLDVHNLRHGERYLMALFLAGAYQEILGDLHNLFGDTNAVHVVLGEGGYQICQVVRGDSVAEVLTYLKHEPKAMVERVRLQVERARREGRISVEQIRLLMRHYEEALAGYTYLSEVRPEK
jgi:arginine decarboxylase